MTCFFFVRSRQPSFLYLLLLDYLLHDNEMQLQSESIYPGMGNLPPLGDVDYSQSTTFSSNKTTETSLKEAYGSYNDSHPINRETPFKETYRPYDDSYPITINNNDNNNNNNSVLAPPSNNTRFTVVPQCIYKGTGWTATCTPNEDNKCPQRYHDARCTKQVDIPISGKLAKLW